MDKLEIESQIEANKKEIERLYHINGALSVKLLKEKYPFKEGAILINEENGRKVRFIKYDYILKYGCRIQTTLTIVNVKKKRQGRSNQKYRDRLWRLVLASRLATLYP